MPLQWPADWHFLRLHCRGALSRAIVIGSDQVAEMDGLAIGKPGGHQDALQQLVAMQDEPSYSTRPWQWCADPTAAARRIAWTPGAVSPAAAGCARALLRLEQPYDCTGSAKIESLGICLVESVRSDDPTALIGLPLISLTSMLAGFGVALPAR